MSVIFLMANVPCFKDHGAMTHILPGMLGTCNDVLCCQGSCGISRCKPCLGHGILVMAMTSMLKQGMLPWVSLAVLAAVTTYGCQVDSLPPT